jgi:hypothetical protein
MSKNRIIDAIAQTEKIKADAMLDYNHQTLLNMALKCIWMSSLNSDVKSIMILRIWGKSPLLWHPLTIKEVAVTLLGKNPINEDEVKAFERMEAFGKREVPKFMYENKNVQELIDAFNANYDSNKREMFNLHNFSGGATNRKRFTA